MSVFLSSTFGGKIEVWVIKRMFLHSEPKPEVVMQNDHGLPERRLAFEKTNGQGGDRDSELSAENQYESDAAESETPSQRIFLGFSAEA